jgi:hypothetical protein
MKFYQGKNKKTDAAQPELFNSAEIYGIREEVQAFIDEWNAKIWLPKIIATPRQVSLIRDAMTKPFFRSHWKETFPIMARSPFLWSKMKPPIKIDWYLESDNFDKILEGHYSPQQPTNNPIGNHTITRVGDDEDIL